LVCVANLMTVLGGIGRGGSLRLFGVCVDVVELTVVRLDDSFIGGDENDMPILLRSLLPIADRWKRCVCAAVPNDGSVLAGDV
jgi:hypothetical protein